MPVAYYLIQPDDRNHLTVKGIYIRPDAGELKQLLEGKVPRELEIGVFSEEAKENYRKVAELFKNKKVSTIIIKSYAFVKPEFSYRVKPSDIEIDVSSPFIPKYILKLKNKKVIITVNKFQDKITVEELKY